MRMIVSHKSLGYSSIEYVTRSNTVNVYLHLKNKNHMMIHTAEKKHCCIEDVVRTALDDNVNKLFLLNGITASIAQLSQTDRAV